MNPSLRDLYQGIILEHNARPRNHGPLDGATHEATANNPLCGDSVTVRLNVDDGVIVKAAFEGNGCAVSRASASLLTTLVMTKTPADALALAADLERFVGKPDPERDEVRDAVDITRLGDLVALQGVRDYPARRRCATLAWEALRAALAKAT